MTCYLCVGRKSLVFTISMTIDVVFVWLVQIGLISVRGIEFDLISVYRDEIEIVVVWVIEIDLVSERGAKILFHCEHAK